MKSLVYVTIIIKGLSRAKLHSAWFSNIEATTECQKLKLLGYDSFFVYENHNYTNGQLFLKLQ